MTYPLPLNLQFVGLFAGTKAGILSIAVQYWTKNKQYYNYYTVRFFQTITKKITKKNIYGNKLTLNSDIVASLLVAFYINHVPEKNHNCSWMTINESIDNPKDILVILIIFYMKKHFWKIILLHNEELLLLFSIQIKYLWCHLLRTVH